MNELISVARRIAAMRIPYVGYTPGAKLRFVAGIGINVAGAWFLLFDGFRHSGLSI